MTVWPFSHRQRDFCTEAGIREAVRRSNNFDPEEGVQSAEAFIIFDGQEERRWIVVTSLRIYLVVDRTDSGSPHIEWSISRSRIFSEQRYVLDVKVSKDGKTVDIGYRKNNPFNRRLIPGGIDRRIRGAVMRMMRPHRDAASP